MAEKFDDDAMLDDLFTVARGDARATPSPEFMAQVLAQAVDIQKGQQAHLQSSATARNETAQSEGIWAVVLGLMGGWRALSGVAMAGVAGVWIGMAAGDALVSNTFGVDLYAVGAESYLSDLDTDYAFALYGEE